MFQFFKRKNELLNKGDIVQEVLTISSSETEDIIGSEDIVKAQDIEPPKYIIKEDAKIMSIPCDHKNVLPQMVLKIDKTLITDPNHVALYVNLGHLNSVDTIEEGYKEIISIKSPCGGPDIPGEVLLSKVILVAGVHYSVIIYDTVTNGKIYDGDVDFITAYTNVAVLPFGVEHEVDPNKVKANFTTVLTKLDDIPGVDFYLYTVDGEVDLEILP